MAQSNNTFNPPVAQQPVLTGSTFSQSWYQWFAQTVAKKLLAPAAAASAVFTSATTGTPGQIYYDQNFVYVCIGQNLWKRAALNAF